MRTITIEEHLLPAALRKVIESAAPGPPGRAPAARYRGAVAAKLAEAGTNRLADMDAAGIDVQVLSVTLAAAPPESFSPATAVALARDCNDELADVVRAHPKRFAGFALLPLQHPEAAAAELERCVTKLGLKGA